MLFIGNNDYKFLKYNESIKQIVQVLNNLIEKPPKTKKIGINAREPFDYTEWQRGLFDKMSVKELSNTAMEEYEDN
jgi:hypothetical protein